MSWHEDWTNAQQALSKASRADTWWKSLPEARRATLGRQEYRRLCKVARQRVKAADERCRALIKCRKGASSAEDARLATAERRSREDMDRALAAA